MANTKKPKPINVETIDLDKLKEKTTDIPGLLEYAHSVGGFSIVPTKEGAIRSKALQVMGEQTQMQLDQIFEQMQLLAKQAKDLKERAQLSELIYESKISFTPVVGKIYYLYQKKDGSKVLSLVSPEEWGNSQPYEIFISALQLLADHTWKVVKS